MFEIFLPVFHNVVENVEHFKFYLILKPDNIVQNCIQYWCKGLPYEEDFLKSCLSYLKHRVDFDNI